MRTLICGQLESHCKWPTCTRWRCERKWANVSPAATLLPLLACHSLHAAALCISVVVVRCWSNSTVERRLCGDAKKAGSTLCVCVELLLSIIRCSHFGMRDAHTKRERAQTNRHNKASEQAVFGSVANKQQQQQEQTIAAWTTTTTTRDFGIIIITICLRCSGFQIGAKFCADCNFLASFERKSIAFLCAIRHTTNNKQRE